MSNENETETKKSENECEIKNLIFLLNFNENMKDEEISQIITNILNKIATISNTLIRDKYKIYLLLSIVFQRDIINGKGNLNLFYKLVFELYQYFSQEVENILKIIYSSSMA